MFYLLVVLWYLDSMTKPTINKYKLNWYFDSPIIWLTNILTYWYFDLLKFWLTNNLTTYLNDILANLFDWLTDSGVSVWLVLIDLFDFSDTYWGFGQYLLMIWLMTPWSDRSCKTPSSPVDTTLRSRRRQCLICPLLLPRPPLPWKLFPWPPKSSGKIGFHMN